MEISKLYLFHLFQGIYNHARMFNTHSSFEILKSQLQIIIVLQLNYEWCFFPPKNTIAPPQGNPFIKLSKYAHCKKI